MSAGCGEGTRVQVGCFRKEASRGKEGDKCIYVCVCVCARVCVCVHSGGPTEVFKQF